MARKKGFFRWLFTTKKGLIVFALMVVFVGGGLWALFGAAPATENDVTFQFVNRNGDEIAATGTIYGSDITGLTQTQQGALQDGEFTAFGTNESGEGFTPDYTTFLYVVVVTCSGYNTVEFILQGTGTVTVSMLPAGTNASILAISATLLTNLKDDAVNTTANTTETDWTLTVQCLNSTGKANNSLGFAPFCDFMGGSVNFGDFGTYTDQFLIEIGFNKTADADWITISGISADVEESGTSLFILVNQEVQGRRSISVTFDDGIGVDFVVSSVYTGFGGIAGYTPLGVLA